jgi:hypothetical protein
MIKRFKVEDELISTVEEYLQNHNLGNRGFEDGNFSRQKIGLIGELTVHKFFFDNYPDLAFREDGFDGGYDINYNGKLIDVKTMGRKTFARPDFVNNFYLLQANHNSDTIVFCSYHTTEHVLEICGWLPKQELATKGTYYAAGTSRLRTDGSSFQFRQNNYEVENKNLYDIDQLKCDTKQT